MLFEIATLLGSKLNRIDLGFVSPVFLQDVLTETFYGKNYQQGEESFGGIGANPGESGDTPWHENSLFEIKF